MVKRPTDKEAWALQKTWAENPPELLEGSRPLTRHRELWFASICKLLYN